MNDVELLLAQARHLPLEQRRRFIRALSALEEDTERQPDAGGIEHQVDGYWYRATEDIPDAQPDYLPTGAVLPESLRLGDDEICLDLVQLDDGWFPLSESGMYTYSHSSNLKYGRECYFRPRSDGSVFRVTLAGEVDRSEVARRFGVVAGDRARSDRKTILLRLTRVHP